MRIFIELPTWLGDTVMATPAIENLLNYYNKSEITIVGSNVSIELLKSHPRIISAIVLEKNYMSLYKLSKDLGNFDNFFSFRSSFRTFIFKILISSKNKYIYKNRKLQDFHQVEKYNNFINRSLNLTCLAGKLNLYSSFQLPVNKLRPVVGVNPGASYGSSKRWYPEKFAEVASKLANNFDIIIFGGPDEINIASDIEASLVKNGILNYQNLAGKTSIQDLIAYISNLDIFITGDSGPMHIAASFQIPTVSIFGPTKDGETSQWLNSSSIIIKKKLECQPCMKRRCPLNHHNCMKLIKAKEVIDAVKLLS